LDPGAGYYRDQVSKLAEFHRWYKLKVSKRILFTQDVVCIRGFGGLGVACWPLVPKFAGSNPAEAVGFLRAKKSSSHLPSEGK
jgi:hypothetical protein